MKSGLPKPTKSDEKWHDQLRQYGCFVCRHYYGIDDHDVPEIHHLLDGGQRVSHRHVIPLCTKHHRQPGKNWEARHSVTGSSGKAAFTKAYRSDWDMLAYIMWRLGLLQSLDQPAPPVA